MFASGWHCRMLAERCFCLRRALRKLRVLALEGGCNCLLAHGRCWKLNSRSVCAFTGPEQRSVGVVRVHPSNGSTGGALRLHRVAFSVGIWLTGVKPVLVESSGRATVALKCSVKCSLCPVKGAYCRRKGSLRSDDPARPRSFNDISAKKKASSSGDIESAGTRWEICYLLALRMAQWGKLFVKFSLN